MTPQERKRPDILAASRKRRIAAGAGVDVAEVNKVLKMHRNMADMMKKLGKGGMKGLAGMLGGMGGGAPGQGPQVNQQQLNALKNLGGGAMGGPWALRNCRALAAADFRVWAGETRRSDHVSRR
jgi:signal recognition particle subunit SRP54